MNNLYYINSYIIITRNRVALRYRCLFPAYKKQSVLINHLQHTKESFNKIAGSYDRRDNQNPILLWMRSVVHKVYLKHISQKSSILELNAGTGVDAVFLANNGFKVFATDISPGMIKALEANALNQVAEGSIQCSVKSFDEIASLPRTDFNAVISNFGGLNCINDFSKLSYDISNKLATGGLFIAVVMNKFCPWEMFYYFCRLDFKNARRRLTKNGIYADLNGEKVKTFYFSPAEFGRHFSEHFDIKKIFTLGYFTPPPYLAGIYNRFKPLVKLFMALDNLIKGIFPFNRFGDHFIIVMEKKC